MKPGFTAFVEDNLRLTPVACVPQISLYTAHPGSGLWRLGGPDDEPPYWAYPWGGGLALARHIMEHPDTVRGRRVLDLGCGGGVVAIAAARSGAAAVLAIDVDPRAVEILALNAAVNGVTVEGLCADPTNGEPPNVDLILAGDVFYEPILASKVGAFLDRCAAAGVPALVGDPRRATLPRHRLREMARYPTPDFGASDGEGAVFEWVAAP